MPVFRRYAAIAASVLVLLTGAAAIGGILLNSSTANAAPKAITSAQASEYFSKAVPLKQSSVRLKLNVRTSPNENFAYVTPVSGFVETVLTFVNKDNTMLWRIEKQNGRAMSATVTDSICGAKAAQWVMRAEPTTRVSLKVFSLCYRQTST